MNALKDTALAASVRQFLESRLKQYGKIERLQIDTKARSIVFSIHLEGEPGPVEISLQGYRILENAGRVSVMAPRGSFTSSRAWLGKALNHELGDKLFEIPQKFASYAKMLAG